MIYIHCENVVCRYLKRGIDENAKCANFVETEQIVTIAGHCLSIVQVKRIILFSLVCNFKFT